MRVGTDFYLATTSEVQLTPFVNQHGSPACQRLCVYAGDYHMAESDEAVCRRQ